VDSKIGDRQHLQLVRYYQRIVDAVKTGAKILIMIPGEAKLELKKELLKDPRTAGKIASVETCDKMTDRQVVARVRSFFQNP